MKKDTEMTQTNESFSIQTEDGYAQFLREWKTSGIVMGVVIAIVVGLVFALREGLHIWRW